MESCKKCVFYSKYFDEMNIRLDDESEGEVHFCLAKDIGATEHYINKTKCEFFINEKR